MRILFILKQMGYVRHFKSVVRALADRGHTVQLAAQDAELDLPASLGPHPRISAVACGSKRGDDWQDHISLLRRSSDYLRYLAPEFEDARKLRARAFEKLARTLSNGQREPAPGAADVALALTAEEQDRLRKVLAMLEGLIPPDASTQEFVRQQRPDLVLITPLIDIGSGQADYVKACCALGVPVAMVLFSWDNLSTKGLIHELPDQVLVWNERQVREAVELHGIPRKRLTITGAPRFDEFFALRPSIDRNTFCARMGFDPAEAIILYLGSSRFVVEREEAFIRRWVEAVRRRPGLERVNVLVKPHPDVHREWGDEGERIAWQAPDREVKARLDRPFPFERVAVVRAPFSGAQFLYDCLHHCAAVVGLNTSAELEAGIVGRPVLTITTPESLADGQDSTLHFHYLLESQGGFVRLARDLDEHCAQLASALAGEFDPARTRAFIEQFLRPHGIDRPATKSMVRAIERMREHLVRRAGRADQAVEASGAPASDAGRSAAAAEPQTVLLDYPGASIRLMVTSDAERRWRAKSCRKEPWTVEWLERNITSGAVLYNIGANVGTFSLIAAKRVPAATVVAFEPGYASYAHLCDNIVLNGCHESIIPVPLPLWCDTGIVGLKYRSLEPGQSRHSVREGGVHRGGSSAKYQQPVLAFRLDDLLRQFSLPPPTHVKLDVDGAESAVLRGAAATLRSPSLESLLVEFEEPQRAEVCQLVEAAGFELVHEVARQKADAPNYGEFRRRT